MKKIAIIYHSGTGHTEMVATAVFEGVKSVNDIQAEIFKATDFSRENIEKLIVKIYCKLGISRC